MTTSRNFVLPYRKGSESVKGLIGSLKDFRGIRAEGSKYKSKRGDLVVNWGNSEPSVDLSLAEVLNHPEDIKNASNKLNFFRHMSQTPTEERPRIPDWTQDPAEAVGWVEGKGAVFARTKLTGHSGEGIVECTTEEQLMALPRNTLLVRYVPKKEEFRLHFFRGNIFDVQRKARTHAVADENVDWRVRSHANGFIYSRNDLDVPEDVYEQARKTIAATDLDFGALDIIYNRWYNQATVLEVNTAPGLTGTTLSTYVEAIQTYAESR